MSGRLIMTAVLLLAGGVRADEVNAPADSGPRVDPQAVAVPAPVESAPAPVAAAVVPAEAPVEEALRAYRQGYLDRRSRITMIAGAGTFSFDYRRRTGEHNGWGAGFIGGWQFRRRDRDYSAFGIAVQWWGERVNRIVPGVVGWSVQAGPMGTAFSQGEGFPREVIAQGGGVAGAWSIHATLPLLNFMFDEPLHGLVPHLIWELGVWGGWAGPMKNIIDADLDGDGVKEHVNGERFVNPDGRSPSAWIGGLLIRSGIVWVF